MKIFIYSTITFLLIGCSTLTENKVVGYYQIDKFTIRDTGKKIIELNYLNLRNDNTFKLSNPIGKDSIVGNWKIINSNSKEGGEIEFTVQTKVIHAKIGGTIIYFEYPNDFYLGYYENVLYIKITQPPNDINK
jgi:hypothetical protein